MNDNAIIELFWERKEEAISITAEKYEAYLYKIAINILPDEQDIKECLNDTYLSVWNSIPPKRPNQLRVYLGKITRNLSLNRLKLYNAKKRGGGQSEVVLSELNDCIPSQNSVEQLVDENFLVASIEKFLYSQPTKKRNIFIRRYWFMNPISEISEAYSMSQSKITSLLHRMRIDLKKHLETEGITL